MHIGSLQYLVAAGFSYNNWSNQANSKCGMETKWVRETFLAILNHKRH